MTQKDADADPIDARFAQIERTIAALDEGQAAHSALLCRMVDAEFSNPVAEPARQKLIDVFRHAMSNHRWSLMGIRGAWTLFIALSSGGCAALTTWWVTTHSTGGFH